MKRATRLTCPHCGKPVKANPIGHWYQRFQCPHCKGQLQFDPVTNSLGMVASALFVVMAISMAMGRAEWTPYFALGAGVLWGLALYLSYALRRVVKG